MYLVVGRRGSFISSSLNGGRRLLRTHCTVSPYRIFGEFPPIEEDPINPLS
jgi:hypothetical protein